LRAFERLKTFLFKAGKVLIPVIVVLSFLNSLGADGSFGNEDSENSALAAISKTITPVLKPFGVSDDNWPATVGVFTGIFAKEAVVGTLDALYTAIDAAEAGEAQETFDFWGAIGASFASIPSNLADLGGTLLDHLCGLFRCGSILLIPWWRCGFARARSRNTMTIWGARRDAVCVIRRPSSPMNGSVEMTVVRTGMVIVVDFTASLAHFLKAP
jgi:hypothetical protein